MSADLHEEGMRGDRMTLIARMAAIEDATILRLVFYGMIAAIGTVLVQHYLDRQARDPLVPAQLVDPANPILPMVERPEIDPANPAFRPAERIATPPEQLAAPLDIALVPGNMLRLRGTFDPGSAARFAEEIAARGEYIETIALDSPGGSVEDALAIAGAIREAGYATIVEAGALCASSCPLVLAAGAPRSIDPAASIGVHQIYAAPLPGREIGAAQAMSDAQATTARVSRHLAAMDVDPDLWLHALETPPDRLYYLTVPELASYRLHAPDARADEGANAMEPVPAPDG